MTIFKISTAFSNINKKTEPHFHSIDPGSKPVEWKPIYTEKELHRAAENGGSYYLAEDIALTKELQIIKNMNLCLNDKVLKQTACESRVITVNNSVYFKLCDCSGENGTTRYWDKDENGLWTLKTDGGASDYKTVGGVITGGSGCFSGGGVYSSGTFIMYGGNITGNSAQERGGGVCDCGSFLMGNGNVTGNSAKSDNDVYMYSRKRRIHK